MGSGLSLCLAALLIPTQCATSADAVQRAGQAWSGEAQEIGFPLEFEVPPGNRLYLYGERIEKVRLSTAPGDSLFLNGVPILPVDHRPVPWHEPPSDEDILRSVGDVPFVQELMASGESPRQAGEKYIEEQARIRHSLWLTYAEARKEKDIPSAVDAALARLPEFDIWDLIDWARAPVASGGSSVKIHWKGMEDSRWTTLMDPSEALEPRMPSERAKVLQATRLYEALTRGNPCWCFIGFGGYDLYCGTESVAEIESELDAVLSTGDLTGLRRLDVHTAREILAKHRVDGGLPN